MLSIDDTSHSQALNRTQPGLPLKKGRGATMTHDCKRNGTTTLFAALTVLDGTVIGQHASRHRHQEFLRFFNRIERTIPASVPVHAILDTDATHKHKDVQVWLARHPRWTFHVTPTFERVAERARRRLRQRTRRRLKDGVCRSGRDLQDAIRRVIDEHDTTEARPFVWTADPDTIIAARKRGFQTLESIH